MSLAVFLYRIFPGFRVGARNDRSANPSDLWEKAERKMTERGVCGEKMFEPECIGREPRTV